MSEEEKKYGNDGTAESAVEQTALRVADSLAGGLEDAIKDGGKEDAGPVLGDGTDISSQFTNLPIGLLICAPFLEIAHGQQALCDVYVETLMRIAYVDSSQGENKDEATRMLDFTYQRPVIDSVTGTVSRIQETIHAPLLSLVPVPAFMMDSATVTFDMDVNVANSETSASSGEVTASTSFSFWTVKTNIQGKLSNSTNRTSSSSSKASYNITVHASQQPAAEGMAKLTSLLAETMEPIQMKQ